MDGEYFRTVIVAREDVHEHPAVQALLPKVLKGLARPESRGFRRALVARMRKVERRTPAGLIAGHALTYDTDRERLGRVVARTVTGLFFHHLGRRLPAGYEVDGFTISGMPRGAPASDTALEMLGYVAARDTHAIGGDIFQYKFVSADDDENAMIWSLLFYGRVCFLGFTVPSDELLGASERDRSGSSLSR